LRGRLFTGGWAAVDRIQVSAAMILLFSGLVLAQLL